MRATAIEKFCRSRGARHHHRTGAARWRERGSDPRRYRGRNQPPRCACNGLALYPLPPDASPLAGPGGRGGYCGNAGSSVSRRSLADRRQGHGADARRGLCRVLLPSNEGSLPCEVPAGLISDRSRSRPRDVFHGLVQRLHALPSEEG